MSERCMFVRRIAATVLAVGILCGLADRAASGEPDMPVVAIRSSYISFLGKRLRLGRPPSIYPIRLAITLPMNMAL